MPADIPHPADNRAGALILACGGKQRRESSPTREIGTLSAVKRLLLTFRLFEAAPIVLVAGAYGGNLQKHAAHAGAVFLQLTDPDAKMFEGVKLGLDYLRQRCQQVLVTTADIPLFSPETLKTLTGSGHKLACPAFGGKAGHPWLIHRELLAGILSYQGPGGLSAAIERCGLSMALVPVTDPGILLEVEQEDEAEEIAARESIRQIRPDIKLCLAKDDVFFGPGTCQLLELIESKGSVRLACQQMNMSYSKSWKLLATVENTLGFTVVDRRQGGRAGGETRLTDRGRDLLQRYQKFESAGQSAIKKLFSEYF
ncbi:MAG: NTP transferase domain-containing protein [Peptococcaceae bacterium]|jgi:molybdate transport repressor ModE-like protein|nr:NTP transferase domain-containing protein [Peptococcaceae bacterium]